MCRALSWVLPFFLALGVVFSVGCSRPAKELAPSGGAGGGSDGVAGAGGGGGSAGESGGSAGTGGAAGLDLSNHAWLRDPSNWKPLPEPDLWDDECRAFEADSSKLSFPPLEWERCGETCERADLSQGYGIVTAGSLSSHERLGREVAFVQVSNWNEDDPHKVMEVHRIIDLESGTTIGAMKVESPGAQIDLNARYVAESYSVTSAFQSFVAVIGKGEAPTKWLYGGFDATRKKWTWQLPARKHFECSDTAYLEPGGGGRWFSICDDPPVVRALLTPGSSELTSIVEIRDEWIPRIPASFGDVVVWSEIEKAKSASRIRGYGLDGRRLRTVLGHLPGDVCAVSMNGTHLAGTLGDGSDCYLYQKNARFWSVRRDAGPAAAASLSPILYDGLLTFWGSATNGSFVATTMTDNHGNWAFILARTRDWSIRFVADEWPAWFTMDAKFLYLMNTRQDAYVGRVKEIRRYELEKFERFGAPFEGFLRDPSVICDLFPCHGEEW